MVPSSQQDECSIIELHDDIIEQVASDMPEGDVVSRLADLFKILGDPTRVRILWALSSAELCVCDISALLGMSQSAISHQLRILKQAHLVRNRRDGRVVYYKLDDEHVEQVFQQGLDHVNHMNDRK